jgi:hypothetical protein
MLFTNPTSTTTKELNCTNASMTKSSHLHRNDPLHIQRKHTVSHRYFPGGYSTTIKPYSQPGNHNVNFSQTFNFSRKQSCSLTGKDTGRGSVLACLNLSENRLNHTVSRNSLTRRAENEIELANCSHAVFVLQLCPTIFNSTVPADLLCV